MAKQYHPDHNKAKDANDKFAQINRYSFPLTTVEVPTK